MHSQEKHDKLASVGITRKAATSTVILTGSTGSLGSYLLDSLLRQHHVKKIYCLNRAKDGAIKQMIVSGARGLRTDWNDGRVEFLHVDLSLPEFGLVKSKHDELLEKATHIIHNQWPVNFNWHLSSFEPHIRGVANMLDFCSESTNGIKFFFVSTIGTVSQIPESEPIQELPNHTLSPHLNGYSASKQICEMLIEEHVECTGLQYAAICRVGQIAGPVVKSGGEWNKQEWLPTIITSSKQLGLLPADLGSMNRIDWVPIDILSEIILELSGIAQYTTCLSKEAHDTFKCTKKSGYARNCIESRPVEDISLSVYHAINPHAVNWGDLVPTVAMLLGITAEKIVPWDQWVEALRFSGQRPFKNTLPGHSLLDFFEALGERDKEKGSVNSMPMLATEHSTAKSKSMAALRPVGSDWMMAWMRQWGL